MALFDLAAFARRTDVSPTETILEWEEPRDIRRVAARFAGPPPDPAEVRLEYWQRNWPHRDPESMSGSHRGWIGQDDPFHGQWVEPRGTCAVEDGGLAFAFDPLDALELPAIDDLERRPGYLARFRRALKLRLRWSGPATLAALSAFSGAREQPFEVRVRRLDGASDGGAPAWRPAVSAYNGAVRKAQWVDEAGLLSVSGLGTDAPPGSRDATLLTFRSEGAADPSFTVNLADLAASPLWIRDLGVYVTGAVDDLPFETWRARVASAPRQPIYERVEREPEQTWARAAAEIPELDVAAHPPFGRYVVLSAEANQQKFALRYNGEVFTGKGLAKLNNRLLERLRWPGRDIHWRIGTGDPPDFRERNGASRQWCEDGWLPIFHTAWRDRDVAYEQTAFAALLEGGAPEGGAPDAWAEQRGDEDSALLMSIVARNTTTSPRRCCVWLHVSPDEALAVDGEGRVLAGGMLQSAQYSPAMAKTAPYDAPVLRALILPSAFQLTALPLQSSTTPNAILCEAWLEPGQAAALDVRIPFASYSRPDDWRRVAGLDARAAREAEAERWRSIAAAGASVKLPAGERDLEDFTRAVPPHILINAGRDPVTRQLVLPPGTFWYGACGNEAAWQTVALDCWGHHDRSRAYLESLLAIQGRIKPDGDFQSADGALQAGDFDQGRIKSSHFHYNLDHGTILEGVLFHYFITGDQAWLRASAPNVLAACDFVTRERAATRNRDARVRGLLPPGHLEDNPEWRYWFAVNGHAHGGMRMAADALAEIGHPEAARIRADAEAYRADILRAAREARIQAPVARLLNGAAVPRVPARAELRWREYGWIREVAYGAIHLWDGGVYPDDAPEVGWLLQDLEDNGFINRELGFGIDVDRDWFSQGGVTPQPNLMSIDLAYLRRDQVKHALRNFYNNLAYGLYRDVRVLAEWMSEPGLGGGPFYKPSDEARVLTWLRHHLVTEEGDTLWLAKGAPRAWFADGESFGVDRAPTFFGRVSYMVASQASRDEIQARIRLSLRRVPAEVRLRLRHPEGRPLRKAFVDGLPVPVDAGLETILLPVDKAGEHAFELIAQYA